MKTKFSRFAISLAVAGAFALVATTFTGCCRCICSCGNDIHRLLDLQKASGS